nr:terpene synthase TPS10 [Freesia viridis]
MEDVISQHAQLLTTTTTAGEIVRQTAEFCPTVWGDFFISYCPSFTLQNFRLLLEQRVADLIEEVKTVLANVDSHPKEVCLIDDLQRLGIAYHFEHEIDDALRRIHSNGYDTDDVSIAALHFRLLRQQGYNVSSDFLYKFKDGEGKFKQELSCAAKDLLCLYEASWLGTQDEKILDEVLDFSRDHLDRIVVNQEGLHGARINHALETPFHHGMRRLEARHYISIYQEDQSSNQILLELAKLDFNLSQSLHQSEIKNISVWWKELALVKKLSFARDRVVECYFWSLGVHFEPQYSQGRMLLTKLITLASVMDDMFDAYGTIEELQLFSDVIQRWEVQDLDHLPEYMQVYLKSLSRIVKEIEEELVRKQRVHYQPYLIESIKALAGAYFHEAKWASKGYMPSLEEYLEISVTSSGYPMLTCASLILMGEVTKDAIDWAFSVPKIVKASALIARLMDDLVTTKLEQKRKHVSSAVQCYMNDNRATEEEASAKLSIMVAGAWKDMNSELLKQCHFKKHLNLLALNFARMIEVIYKHEDGYTNPSGQMKDNIDLVLVHPTQD